MEYGICPGDSKRARRAGVHEVERRGAEHGARGLYLGKGARQLSGG